jgi:mycofactocin system glycosyltransferase
MKEFAFSLRKHVSLEAGPEGFFLVSLQPVKNLRMNEPLYLLLKHIQAGGELSGFSFQTSSAVSRRFLYVLLSLVHRGYLNLDRIAEPEPYPVVSVIVPVRDQLGDLGECLHSLAELDYPPDRLDIIVVDDGSRKEVSRVISSSGVTIIRQHESQGPATCRNIGAGRARGEFLAFLDADCVAGNGWLKELVPFFRAAGVGAVGGNIEGYHQRGLLDRYEAVASPLNMGRRLVLEGKTSSTFYVPAANLLVKRDIFLATGGFKAGMRTGEDVDFCWRLRDGGSSLLYVPFGSVAHKHRNRPVKMFARRARYGTSEAVLYRDHHDKRKTFLFPVLPALSFLVFALAVIWFNPYPLAALPFLFLVDAWRKSAAAKNHNISLKFGEATAAAFRGELSFYYFTFFHLVRYYLVPIIGSGFLWHPFWLFGGLAILFSSLTDYFAKKPRLPYPFFLFIYLGEHLAYQVGVFWGCLRQLYFGSYRLSFRRARF